MSFFFAVLGQYRIGIYVALLATLIGSGWWGYSAVYGRGVTACETKYKLAAAEAATADHTSYLAAVQWGNQVSAALAKAQRRGAALKENYRVFAHDLVGTCPQQLRVLHDAAATGANLPDAAGPPAAATATVAARDLGEAVVDNYARCRGNADQLNALIDWHEGVK